MSKYFANRGVERNKKPLKNIVYTIIVDPLAKILIPINYQQYKFKDLGYLVMKWRYDEKNAIQNFHGFITPDSLKKILGEKQWSKFCQGKREFVIQRRIDGKNIKKITYYEYP